MLVIRRHAGQSIRIGDSVEIEIIECAPHRVKLGIRRPERDLRDARRGRH